jgi:hypothetical protein
MPKAKRNARANARHNRRVKNLVMVTSLSAVVLIASTYAWFVGLQAVNVTPFEIEIAAADSLELSINGEEWSETLTLTRENVINTEDGPSGDKVNQIAYENNTNNWPASGDNSMPQAGLVPVSTVGLMDTASSRMVLYEKASFTTTPGGYRLLASKVNNNVDAANQKQRGYVAFDLFVKNYSGTEYITDIEDPANDLFEEAIYLTTNSEVNVASNGVGESGIENSVRVAFAQIGRISGYSNSPEAITGISCTTAGEDENQVTGLCRRAQIWEPNDKAHKTTAIKYYEASCLKRTGATLADGSYSIPVDGNITENDKCTQITDQHAYPTYSISRVVGIDDAVDIYDGLSYNKYDGNTINEIVSEETDLKLDDGNTEAGSLANGDEGAKPLVAVDTFTDTEKNYKGNKRPTFMTLAPNSITKIRVYIYIEGQDIDNYDYAQVGKQIKVQFGFSKQRFTADEVRVTDDPDNNNDLYDNLPTSVKPQAN